MSGFIRNWRLTSVFSCVKAPSSFTERLSHRAARRVTAAWERRRNARADSSRLIKSPF